ncbi:uncharacterized protein LOC135681414 [Rhopilema esculentum]|uniref:uncharacterized protein LOC135681414 n=1 Tax=Rhopilema esculentum TaxID=499914 RepID=UPI0031CF96DC|eukprot:gene13491-4370_t
MFRKGFSTLLKQKLVNNVPKRCAYLKLGKYNSWRQSQDGRRVKFALVMLGTVAGAGGLLGVYVNYASNQAKDDRKKKIVVLGSGWGAVSFLKHLKPDSYEVSVVSPSNYFLFTPFLPSVTVGTVEGRSIVEPIRKIIRKYQKQSAEFYEAECIGVDANEKRVYCQDTSGIIGKQSDFSLDYDILVVAVGAETATYGTPGVKEYTHFLKDIKDVQRIRSNIMDHLETAAYPGQEDSEVSRLLHFVVVGGGPTGVEFAAELRDFVGSELSILYPKIKDKIKLTLIGGYRGVLSTYDQEIGNYVEDKFKDDNIEIVQGARVLEINSSDIKLRDGKTKETVDLPYGMCVWAAGISPRQLTKDIIKSIPGQRNKNALLTDDYLQVKNAPGVFAIGDCGTIEMKKLMSDVTDLFEKADANKDGSLSMDEFREIMEQAKNLYPQVSLHFSTEYNESLQRAFEKADENKDQRLSLDEFKGILAEIDKELKSLPATAQVATQQGRYLANFLSTKAQGDVGKEANQDLAALGAVPFAYRHLGSFAYVGNNRAVLELPLIGSFKGFGAMLLWRAAYTNECVGMRMKVLVVFDWLKSEIFGRDTSRI